MEASSGWPSPLKPAFSRAGPSADSAGRVRAEGLRAAVRAGAVGTSRQQQCEDKGYEAVSGHSQYVELNSKYIKKMDNVNYLLSRGWYNVTLRSAVLGIVVVVAIVTGAPYSIWMVRSSEITWSYFPTSAGFCFVVILLANALVRWIRPLWALRPAELAIIVIMGLAATGIPTFIVGTLLAIISSPYYGATPENDWAGNIHPYLPDWIVPRADGDAMRWFYEGTAQGASPAV